MPQINACLFGGFEISDGNGGELTLGTRKARALLAFLIVEADRWHTRDRWAGLLWSDRQQARHSLTQALSTIRKLGDGADVTLIEGDSERVRLLGAAISADALSLREKLERDAATAVELYAGPLLDSFIALDAAFDEWLATERAAFHEQACTALRRAIDQAEARDDTAKAIAATKRWVALDPYTEPAHRQLMSLLAASGDRAEAIRQYQACEKLLRDELGVEPSAETRALAEDVRAETSTAEPRVKWKHAPDLPEMELLLPTDRLSIAVLSFVNMSTDPEQEHFADGIAEDIITALSKISRMRVIARNSIFAYRGQAHDLRQVASELGVRYVLEGSIRSSGNRLRITAQLIDANDGSHIWAERFDRTIDDIFDIQDEITKEIVTALRVNLTDGEEARVMARGTNDIEAWQLCVRATELYLRFNATDFLEARALAEKALQRDPNYAYAWATLGLTFWFDGRLGYTMNSKAKFARANECAKRAMALDDTISQAIILSVHVAGITGHEQKGVAIARRGLELYPGNADVRGMLGFALVRVGNYREAVDHFRAAMSLNPFYPNWYRNGLARALMILDEFDQALVLADETLRTDPANIVSWVHKAYMFGQIGRYGDAEEAIRELAQIAPNLRLKHVPEMLMINDATAAQRIVDGLRKVGFSE